MIELILMIIISVEESVRNDIITRSTYRIEC